MPGNPNKRHVSAPVLAGGAGPDDREVVLSLYGPRGGNRALEGLTPGAARKLGRLLMDAADSLDPEGAVPPPLEDRV